MNNFIKLFIFLLTFIASSSGVWAADLGFRYADGACLNESGEEGLNPSHFGQCSDLRGVILSGFELDGIDFSGSKFDGSNFQGSSFRNTILVDVSFAGAQLSGVEFIEARIKNTNFMGATLSRANFASANIEYVNFSGVDFSSVSLSFVQFKNSQFVKTNFTDASLDEAQFIECALNGAIFNRANLKEAKLSKNIATNSEFREADLRMADLSGLIANNSNFSKANLAKAILVGADLTGSELRSSILDEADFSKAKLNKSNLSGSSLSKANLNEANFSETILSRVKMKSASFDKTEFSGAIYNKRTELPFDDKMAKAKGMVLRISAEVLIIWDIKSDPLKALVEMLKDSGEAEVTWSETNEVEFTGEGLENYDVVLHFNGSTYDQEMTTSGQMALVQYVRDGGMFMTGEWNSYELQQGRMTEMRDLLLYERNGTTLSSVTLGSADKEASSHPLLDGFRAEFVVNKISYLGLGALTQFDSEPAQPLLTVNGNPENVALAVRKLGKGKAIGLAFAHNYEDGESLLDESIQKIFLNAVRWSL